MVWAAALLAAAVSASPSALFCQWLLASLSAVRPALVVLPVLRCPSRAPCVGLYADPGAVFAVVVLWGRRARVSYAMDAEPLWRRWGKGPTPQRAAAACREPLGPGRAGAGGERERTADRPPPTRGALVSRCGVLLLSLLFVRFDSVGLICKRVDVVVVGVCWCELVRFGGVHCAYGRVTGGNCVCS